MLDSAAGVPARLAGGVAQRARSHLQKLPVPPMSTLLSVSGITPNPADPSPDPPIVVSSIVARMKGFLIDGPAAGTVVEAGEPAIRRGIVVPREGGFAEDAYRYYLRSIDSSGAAYTFGGKVPWPPEARSHFIRPLMDEREYAADEVAPGARHNGD